MPVITARQMLDWLDGRNGSSFAVDHVERQQRARSTIAVGAGANGLHAMVPATANGSPVVSLRVNGQSVAFTLQTIKGQQYAVFAAQSGNLPGELRCRRGRAPYHCRQRVAIRIERDRAMDHERGVRLAR